MFEIKEKQKVLPDGTKITTFTREVASANTIEVEVGTTGFKGGNANCGSRTYICFSAQMFLSLRRLRQSRNPASSESANVETVISG